MKTKLIYGSYSQTGQARINQPRCGGIFIDGKASDWATKLPIGIINQVFSRQ
jgi:hypothetical protein